MDESFVVGGPVGDSELLLCHGMVCVVGRIRDLILQLSKSSIYSTKPIGCYQSITSSWHRQFPDPIPDSIRTNILPLCGVFNERVINGATERHAALPYEGVEEA